MTDMLSTLENYPSELKKRIQKSEKNGIVIENYLQFEDAETELEDVYSELKKGKEVLIVEGEIIEPDDNWGKVLFKERDKVFVEVVGKYVKTSNRKIQKSIRNVNKDPYEDILKEVGFKKIKKDTYSKGAKRNVDDLINWIYEYTLFSKDRFNGKEKEFEKELRDRWHEINPSGVYKEKAIWRVWSASK